MVTVSQNKLGLAIQLLWNDEVLSKGKDVRCSIDLIPTFTIEEEFMETMTRSVNREMFSFKRPPGWFKTLVDYANRNKVLGEDEFFNEAFPGNDPRAGLIPDNDQRPEARTKTVMLKILNYANEDYYYIRPGMKWKDDLKFSSAKMGTIYCMMKALLKGFRMTDRNFKGVDQFMAKQVMKTKLYGREEGVEKEWEGERDRFFVRMAQAEPPNPEQAKRHKEEAAMAWKRNEDALLLYLVLHQQFFKQHFEKFIDFDKWHKVVKHFRAMTLDSRSEGPPDRKRMRAGPSDIYIPVKSLRLPSSST